MHSADVRWMEVVDHSRRRVYDKVRAACVKKIFIELDQLNISSIILHEKKSLTHKNLDPTSPRVVQCLTLIVVMVADSRIDVIISGVRQFLVTSTCTQG